MILWFIKKNNDGTADHFHCTPNDAYGVEQYLKIGYEFFGYVESDNYRVSEWKLSEQVWEFWFGKALAEHESTQMVHD